MPVKLDLKTQMEEERQGKKAASSQKTTRPNTPKAKTKQGRPKEAPCVTRSLRIKQDLNEKLVAMHNSTKLSYNELVNRALSEYLK